MRCAFKNTADGSDCKFEFADDYFVELEGATWCPLHVPASEKKVFSLGGVYSEVVIAQAANLVRRELPVSFRGCVFRDHLMLPHGQSTILVKEWDFFGAVFLAPFEFTSVSSWVNLSGCKFEKLARIHGNISERLDTSGSTFIGAGEITAQPGELIFSSSARPTSAVGQFRFYEGDWGGPVTLDGSKQFAGELIAERLNFRRRLSAANCRFEQSARFNSCAFGDVEFDGSEFLDIANFNNSKFSDWTSFRNVVFHKAPRFHQADLHPDTTFSGAHFNMLRGEAAAGAYRSLKYRMEINRNRAEEARFYEYEQRSTRRAVGISAIDRELSRLYDWSASYGNSITRPLIWLASITLVFSGIYAGWSYLLNPENFRHGLTQDWLQTVDHFLNFTLQQLVRPLAAWSPFMDLPDEVQTLFRPYSIFVRIVATLQSIISLTFVALFLFAIRRRFKME